MNINKYNAICFIILCKSATQLKDKTLKNTYNLFYSDYYETEN